MRTENNLSADITTQQRFNWTSSYYYCIALVMDKLCIVPFDFLFFALRHCCLWVLLIAHRKYFLRITISCHSVSYIFYGVKQYPFNCPQHYMNVNVWMCEYVQTDHTFGSVTFDCRQPRTWILSVCYIVNNNVDTIVIDDALLHERKDTGNI